MRRVRRTLVGAGALLFALVVQMVIVNRSSLPGGGIPDLVLITVAALGVANGPMGGLLAGFFGGLALDIAPPGGHLAGEYALVFCLVGYWCGRLREMLDTAGEPSTVSALTVMAAGVIAGECGKVAIGLMVSDPNVTVPVVEYVLPGAVLYDLLLSPFALWLISFLSGRSRPARERERERVRVIHPQFRPRLLSTPQAAGVFRLASEGGVPRLRLADARRRSRIVPARREPKLHLRSSGRSAFLASRSAGGTSLTPSTSVSGRPARLNFSSPGPVPNGAPLLRQGSSKLAKPGKGWLRSGGRGKRGGWPTREGGYRPGSATKYRYRRGRGIGGHG
jgi:rod shape-determining protein MreD